jgi:hypothetical protein
VKHDTDQNSGVTFLAVVIALLLIAFLAVLGFIVEMLLYLAYDFNTQSPPISPLGSLFLLTLVNMAIARRWRGLSRRELLVVYAMVTVSVPLIAHGTLVWLFSISIGQYEHAHRIPAWSSVFSQYVPSWFCPSDPDAVDGFFRGQASVPWGLWLRPAAAWGAFFCALYLANLCLLVVFRRQWATNERLSFPIAQVPLEFIHEGGDGAARLTSAKAFWAGFGVVCLLGLLARLSAIFPSIPRLSLDEWVVMPWQPTGPLAGIGDFTVSLSPWLLGLAYLIPKELSLSVWVFWYLRVAETMAAIAAGVTPMRPQDFWGTEFPAPYYQGGGAVLALGILLFWTARHYLRRAIRDTVTGRAEDDAHVALGYRVAFLGLGLSVSYMVLFCMAAGSRFGLALLLVGLVLAYHMVWARLRAENGMSFIGFPLHVGSALREPFGTASLRPREVITINALAWTYKPGWGEGCEVITGASADALKIADSASIAQRLLVVAMCIAFVFALVLGTYVVLTGTYGRGFWNFGLLYYSWMPSGIRNLGQANYDAFTNPTHFSLAVTAPIVGGMLVTFVLATMRLRFWWWPLHPVGYLASNVWGTQTWWCPMFIGWLVKLLVIRYGGLRLYQRTMPAAVGMILADRLLSFVWPLILALARRW